MKDRTLIRTGVVGAVIAAICCFTPVLVIGLGVVGLSAWLDYVLLPALVLSIGPIGYGIWRQRRAADCCAPIAQSKNEGRGHG
ncbi:hypothetical protein ATO13_19055 [Stappia sp. 22II-S9-Z10]|nr:hypothetical protein ATO13_19055 [Stappia sp. 22II-S9-Z10]